MSKTLVFACVCLCFGVVVASDDVGDQKTVKNVQESSRIVGEVLSPISGRVFHADYVRDGGVSRSFRAKNFERLGFHVENVRRRAKRDEEARWKKHVYGESSRFVGSLGKKYTSIDTKLNRHEFTSGSEKRYKRELEDAVENDDPKPFYFQEGANGRNEMPAAKEKEHETRPEKDDPNTTDKIVAEDNKPQVKNNDTDKTLFVNRKNPLNEADALKTPELGSNDNMKKTVVDDSVKLYPVYRGVNHRYFRTRRQLHSSHQLENKNLHSEGGSSQLEQGRSRRPLRRLALPLLLALKLKTALLLPVLLGLVGLIGLKGLWAGMTGLAISAALGLKALLAGSTKVLVQPPPPPPPPHIHHFPPHEVTEYWSRNDLSDYHPSHNSWT